MNDRKEKSKITIDRSLGCSFQTDKRIRSYSGVGIENSDAARSANAQASVDEYDASLFLSNYREKLAKKQH